MPVDINGTTGIESPGYSQGGSPIVESGSNSDGQWTRWADGTQSCYALKNINWSTAGRVNYPLPLTFTDPPAVFFSGIPGTNADYRKALGDAGMQGDSAAWDVVINYVAGFTLDIRLGALGRWK